ICMLQQPIICRRSSPSFLLLHHSPRSTLFPYTTLFRSHYMHIGDYDAAIDRLEDAIDSKPGYPIPFRYLGEAQEKKGLKKQKGIDRKSTRLNSSHGSISYAVFCLKKKKKQHHSIQ